jgi:hypothetical protein
VQVRVIAGLIARWARTGQLAVTSFRQVARAEIVNPATLGLALAGFRCEFERAASLPFRLAVAIGKSQDLAAKEIDGHRIALLLRQCEQALRFGEFICHRVVSPISRCAPRIPGD